MSHSPAPSGSWMNPPPPGTAPDDRPSRPDKRKHSRRRSRSPGFDDHRHKRIRRSSRSRRSRSRSRSRRRHERRHRRRSRSSSGSGSPHRARRRRHRSEDYEEDETPTQENTFKNDGSFLEMFKKMQEEKAAEENKPEGETNEGKKTLPIFGKRRGGRVLKTGLVQKPKNPTEVEDEPKDAWSVYMKEVKRYKEACCDDDSKTRPLVK